MENTNQEIPQQPAQPKISPQQLNNSNWLRALSIGLGIIGIGLVIGIGGYFLAAKNSQPPVQKTAIQPSPTPIDETANWKTYANTEYGYTIKYPSEIIHETESIKDFPSQVYNATHDYFKINDGILEIYGLCGRGSIPLKSVPIQIDGRKTTKVYETYLDKTYLGGFITAIPRPNSNESICFNFSLPDGPNTTKVDALFDQILSTFKFTDENLDGKVWVDIDQIGIAINIYYSDNKKLPQNLETLTTYPGLNNFKLNNDPYTGKPYQFTTKSDGSGFVLSGTVRDGTEYKKEFSIK